MLLLLLLVPPDPGERDRGGIRQGDKVGSVGGRAINKNNEGENEESVCTYRHGNSVGGKRREFKATPNGND